MFTIQWRNTTQGCQQEECSMAEGHKLPLVRRAAQMAARISMEKMSLLGSLPRCRSTTCSSEELRA